MKSSQFLVAKQVNNKFIFQDTQIINYKDSLASIKSYKIKTFRSFSLQKNPIMRFLYYWLWNRQVLYSFSHTKFNGLLLIENFGVYLRSAVIDQWILNLKITNFTLFWKKLWEQTWLWSLYYSVSIKEIIYTFAVTGANVNLYLTILVPWCLNTPEIKVKSKIVNLTHFWCDNTVWKLTTINMYNIWDKHWQLCN